jgi:LPS-assembly lipoprotein
VNQAGLRRSLLLGGCGLVVGCGFQLRTNPPMAFTRLALLGFANRSPLERELRATLAPQVQLVPGPAQAEVVMRVTADERQRVVVASTAAAQVREIQLRLRLAFRLESGGGRELAPVAELMQARDLSYSETQALAKEHEEAQILRDMQADIVQQVLRRLSAVKL